MREIRVFVSSPDDASLERKRLAQVVERLNGEIRGLATIQPVRWETAFYKAHTTFQKQIPEAADCEIVVGILRHRLGTPLPSDFPRMANGDPYPSGTAYEVLSALEKRLTSDLPDVYVFRYSEPPIVRLDDAAGRKLVEEQWERVKAFFGRWFLTAEGQFKAAFQTFNSTDDFEVKVEALLRQWIEDHLLRGRSVVWPVQFKGSPFRGLEAFGLRHAPVFFGRSRDIARTTIAIKDAAERGTPYLIVIGPSGAGKSSLVRAGLVPRLTAPGVVAQVDCWRVVTMRPGERGANPFSALAEQLLRKEALGEDADQSAALPEIAHTGYETPKDLADLLAHADDSAAKPILHALDRVAESERAKGGYERLVGAALLLVVDQLDELLAADVPEEIRSSFANLLTVLLKTSRVWVVTTLRADLYERYIANPALAALKTEGAAYDLQPPGPPELAEIVRLPAQAADLVYEADGAGATLDERLLADAARADILPLVQFTLNRLFDERVNVNGKILLTHAAYDAIGGLDGAIDHEAERALASLGEAEVRALPRILRELAMPAHDEHRSSDAGHAPTLAIRAVPLARAAYDEPAARLVRALIDARILLSSGSDAAAATVRVAHQRVLESWKRARDIVAAHGDFFRIREEVEDERQRWEAAGRPRNRLIPAGLRLAEAEAIRKRFGDEIPPAMLDFISASSGRARLKQRMTLAAAIVFFGVAVAAGYLGWLSRESAQAEHAAKEQAQQLALAEQEARKEAQRMAAAEQQARQRAQLMAASEFAAKQRAEHNFKVARETVDAITAQVAESLRGSAGVPLQTVQNVLSSLDAAVSGLRDSRGARTELARSRANMLIEFGDTYKLAGDSRKALDAYQEGVTLARELVKEPGSNWELAVALQRSGILRFRIGEPEQALAELEEALTLGRALVAEAPDDVRYWQHMSRALNDIGDVYKRTGKSTKALASFGEAVGIGRRLVAAEPEVTRWKQEIAASLLHQADVEATLGAVEDALARYKEALSYWRTVAESDPGNLGWQQDVTVGLVSLADVQFGAAQIEDARVNYEEALAIRRRLVSSDAGNLEWQRDLGETLDRVGDIRLRLGDAAGGLAVFEEALSYRRGLAKQDPHNHEWQRDVSASLSRVGDSNVALGNSAAALPAYEESLAILKDLTAFDPRNTRWQRNMAGVLKKLGDLEYTAGRTDRGLAFYDEALAIRRELVELDPANQHWQVELLSNLEAIARMTSGEPRASAVKEGLTLIEGLQRSAGSPDGYAERSEQLRSLLE